MPLRPENIMTTLLLTAIMLLVLLSISGMAVVLWLTPDGVAPPMVYVLAVVLLAMKVVLSMLQTEFAARQMHKDVDSVHASMEQAKHQATTAVNAAVETAKAIHQDVIETKGVVAELAKSTNGELTSAIREAGEQARLGERHQVLQDVLNSSEFEDLLFRVATEAANVVVSQRCKEPPS